MDIYRRERRGAGRGKRGERERERERFGKMISNLGEEGGGREGGEREGGGGRLPLDTLQNQQHLMGERPKIIPEMKIHGSNVARHEHCGDKLY